VVGAGQLARMLQPPAVALGVQLRVLATDPRECALQVIPDAVVVPNIDADAMAKVSAGAAALTFEHEHVEAQWLEPLNAAGVAIRPHISALHLARDKAALRLRLSELNVPQPKWAVVDDEAAAAKFGDHIGWPFVLKPSRGGYDGRGVFVVSSPEDVKSVMQQPVREGALWLAEEFVEFAREVAAQVARSPQGQAVAYPLVRTLQRDGMCAEVVAPCPDSDSELATEATQLALALARDIDAVGMLAVEMYVVIDSVGAERLLVNEIALRPHNSGHWSIDGAVTSQFENHLRAVLDLPLGDPTALAPYAVMVNVIGADADNLHYALLHCQAREPQARIHIYGKEIRPGRKVGHVTLLGDSVEPLLERARHIAAYMRGDIHE
jgi:5-(carboxyamino)imidazole ribonucleotide synthase